MEEQKKKFNVRMFGLSILLYYIVNVWLAIVFGILSISLGRNYGIAISLLVAVYFYQKNRDKLDIKKEIIWVGCGALITALVLVLL
ncbi:MAG: hypothetical protein AAB561_00700 [Patescibacteria group bacterium]